MNIVGFLKTIFIIVLVYYAITFINRFFLNRFVRRVQKVREEQRKASSNRKREGDVTIDSNRQGGKKINKDMGDYIDYEEIDK